MIGMNKICFFFLLLGISLSLQAMDRIKAAVSRVNMVAQQVATSKIKKAFETPHITFEKPINILRTPLVSGTLQEEAASVIHQIKSVIELHKETPDCIRDCLIMVGDKKDRKAAYDYFAKMVNPSRIRVQVLPVDDIKIAVSVNLFSVSKQKKKAKL